MSPLVDHADTLLNRCLWSSLQLLNFVLIRSSPELSAQSAFCVELVVQFEFCSFRMNSTSTEVRLRVQLHQQWEIHLGIPQCTYMRLHPL